MTRADLVLPLVQFAEGGPRLHLGRGYPATIVKWSDGDTVKVSVDLGFYVRQELVVRLDGIDTPERGQEGHREASDYVKALAPEGSEVVLISTQKDREKWGRWMGRILAHDGAGTMLDVSDVLLRKGLAVEYHGGTKGVPSATPGVPAASPGASAGA